MPTGVYTSTSHLTAGRSMTTPGSSSVGSVSLRSSDVEELHAVIAESKRQIAALLSGDIDHDRVRAVLEQIEAVQPSPPPAPSDIKRCDFPHVLIESILVAGKNDVFSQRCAR